MKLDDERTLSFDRSAKIEKKSVQNRSKYLLLRAQKNDPGTCNDEGTESLGKEVEKK